MTRETLLEKVYGESEEKIDDEYKEVVIEQFNESINLFD
jgi:DNA-binding response OmpR family regulator